MSDEVDALMSERTALQLAQRTSRETSRRGLLLLASVPIVGGVTVLVVTAKLSAVLSILMFLWAGIFTIAAVVRGLAMITAGSVKYHQASAQLAALDNRLPEARVVVR